MSDSIDRITLSVPEAQLAELRQRLAATRWPAGGTVSGTSQGPTLQKMKVLLDHWQNSYDWRKVESELNGWGVYRTTINGLDIDFLHIRSPEVNATPLVLTHGWPGSVLEFRKTI
jgi:pimeloyl-ACP methyl ester carboxylesterase